MTLRVALIGYGTGGAVFHAPLISSVPELRLDAIVTSRRDDVLARYPGVEVLDGTDRLWEATDRYDLVVISVPNRKHVALAREALTSGMPVVLDKPVAATAADARSLAALAAVRGLPVIPFHNRRWDGDFRTVAQLVEDGALGAVPRLESRFERWRPRVKESWKESADPRDAGGVLFDLGAHLIDQAVALFGRPGTVYAEIDTRRPGATTSDDVFVALTHPGGEHSHLWMSATAADLGPRFRILGADASYVVSGMDPQEDALREGRTPADDPAWGQAPSDRYGRRGTPDDTRPEPTMPGAYQEFYRAVARTLTENAPPPVDLNDAITGLDIIEAATESSKTRTTITLKP
ncbi:Gfo/Idh/MocA family oxidoreductase [Actinomadura flavalba]|uniref:Gfo/Idh/MocA family oxidoreductase n=1 Tax=Actinomadura flavalba TaxID=1120938 RepID=UPI00037050E2|nr:Gfo/Idh/MocA family oxidoreductase [Actinomadura flavalba]